MKVATILLAVSASWYSWRPGEAAAGPALRSHGWRGSTAIVCVSPIRWFHLRCLVVRLTDWCQCYRGTATERAIDLNKSDFARLAPPSRGLIRVVVFH